MCIGMSVSPKLDEFSENHEGGVVAIQKIVDVFFYGHFPQVSHQHFYYQLIRACTLVYL